jgi:iron(III) transport system substrate-binding protein
VTLSRLGILPLFVVALVASSCGGSDGRRALVVYSAHAKDILGDFERAFEAAHPSVDVRTVYLGSNELHERIRAEKAAPQCDVWWGGDSVAMTQAAQEGLLATYRPSYAAEDVPHDPEWRWSACFVLPMVLGYESRWFPKEDLPKKFADLAEPRFKDRLVLREPSASGTMRTLIGALIAREVAAGRGEDAGFALLRGIAANVHHYEGKPELLFEALDKGPAGLTVWNLTDLLFQRAEKGYRFLPAPLEEPVPATLDGVALTPRGAANADASAFYEFVNTPESLALLAERHWRIPVRPGFDRAKLRAEIRDFPWKRLEVDEALMAAKTASWMRRFEEETRAAGARGK